MKPPLRFSSPTAHQIVAGKLHHLAQNVRIVVTSREFDLWSSVSKKEDYLMWDWLQMIIRRAAALPLAKQAKPAELKEGDGQSMVFVLTNEEFDAAGTMAAKCGMKLRQWLYSTFLAAVEGRNA